MGNEKWETGKWGNGTATLSNTTQVVNCKIGQYRVCKLAQVLARGSRPIVLFSDPSGEESRRNESALAVAWIEELECVHISTLSV